MYNVTVDGSNVNVLMTLTFPGCGMGAYIANNVRERILDLDDVEDANVEMTFDPPWSPEKISEAVREELGID